MRQQKHIRLGHFLIISEFANIIVFANKLCLVSILYIKNSNEKCFIEFKAHARGILSLF